MPSDRRQPGVAFWATVVMVVVLVAYPLSFGPWCWLTCRTTVGAQGVPSLYRPFTLVLDSHRTDRIGRAILWYTSLGAPNGYYSLARVADDDETEQWVFGEYLH
jgi:hypothetical protein